VLTTDQRVEELGEHEVRDVELTAAEAAALQARNGGLVSISITERPGVYRLSAGSLVGTTSAGSVRILVRPKVPLRNLLYLLGVGLDDIRWWERTFPYESQQELLPAFLAFFARTLRQALSAGLLRTYRWEQARPAAVRGRIDFAEQLRAPGIDARLACAYEDFTSDNELNRYLRAAVRRAMLVADVPPAMRQVLLGELARFGEVADITVRGDELDGHHHTRLDEHYRTPLGLARLVLRGGTIVDRLGGQTATPASEFAIDMNQLFEDFVAEGLRRRLSPDLLVEREPRVPLDTRHRVSTYPDLVIRRWDRTVAHIADAKYKLTETGLARNPDYYQLLSYATVLQQNAGTLIYNTAAEEGSADEPIEVRHAGITLATYSVDLSGDLEDLEREIDVLAQWLHART